MAKTLLLLAAGLATLAASPSWAVDDLAVARRLAGEIVVDAKPGGYGPSGSMLMATRASAAFGVCYSTYLDVVFPRPDIPSPRIVNSFALYRVVGAAWTLGEPEASAEEKARQEAECRSDIDILGRYYRADDLDAATESARLFQMAVAEAASARTRLSFSFDCRNGSVRCPDPRQHLKSLDVRHMRSVETRACGKELECYEIWIEDQAHDSWTLFVRGRVLFAAGGFPPQGIRLESAILMKGMRFECGWRDPWTPRPSRVSRGLPTTVGCEQLTLD